MSGTKVGSAHGWLAVTPVAMALATLGIAGCAGPDDPMLSPMLTTISAGGEEDSDDGGDTDAGGDQDGDDDNDEGDDDDRPDDDDGGDAADSGSDGAADATDGAADDDPDDDGAATEDDDGDPGGEPIEVRLTNVPDACVDSNGTTPLLPDEADHVIATVLTPDAYPFTVTRVEYELLSGGACNATLPHVAYAFPIEVALPTIPSTLPSFHTGVVAQDATATDGRIVSLPLDEPLTLEEGESFVVAVRMAVTASVTESLCMASCLDQPQGGLDFWSNVAFEPYDWQDLVTEYSLGNSKVSAFGFVDP